MQLEKLFPATIIQRHPFDCCPGVWQSLLKMSKVNVAASLIEYYCLEQHTSAASLISTITDVGVLLPARKRQRNDQRYWKIAIALGADNVLIHNCPLPERLQYSCPLPEEYRRVVTECGVFQIGRSGGQSLWPRAMAEIFNELSPRDTNLNRARVTAFFDHGTGDFDCWLDDKYDVVWYYDHETRWFDNYSSGGLGGWFEKQLLEYASNARLT